jgi:hypothetical protein
VRLDTPIRHDGEFVGSSLRFGCPSDGTRIPDECIDEVRLAILAALDGRVHVSVNVPLVIHPEILGTTRMTEA